VRLPFEDPFAAIWLPRHYDDHFVAGIFPTSAVVCRWCRPGNSAALISRVELRCFAPCAASEFLLNHHQEGGLSPSTKSLPAFQFMVPCGRLPLIEALRQSQPGPTASPRHFSIERQCLAELRVLIAGWRHRRTYHPCACVPTNWWRATAPRCCCRHARGMEIRLFPRRLNLRLVDVAAQEMCLCSPGCAPTA